MNKSMRTLTLKIRQNPLQMVIHRDTWHPYFLTSKASRVNITQLQEINFTETAQKRFSTAGGIRTLLFRLRCNKKVALWRKFAFHLRTRTRTTPNFLSRQIQRPSDNPPSDSPAPLSKRYPHPLPFTPPRGYTCTRQASSFSFTPLTGCCFWVDNCSNLERILCNWIS